MSREIGKPQAVEKLCAVALSGVKETVLKISDKMWSGEDSRKENNFACFHHTQHIVFRFITDMEDHTEFHTNRSWHLWEPMFMPIMQQVAAVYGFNNAVFPKAMLAKLKAGHEIDPHQDQAPPNRFTHKVHIPIVTNPDVRFYVDGHAYELAEGFAYEVNNLQTHAVVNDGKQDRVHFIFELYDEELK